VNNLITHLHSSEYSDAALRPKLDLCYTTPTADETCITIQRPAGETGEVSDTYINSLIPNLNYGANNALILALMTSETPGSAIKYSLIRFDFTVESPDVDIIKYTNGFLANDPDGADVPRLVPGQPVEWTYRVSNVGSVAVAREEVVVTDNQPGVTPAFDSEVTGNGDTIFDPGEVWLYSATGTAVDLDDAPDGVIVFPDRCTKQGVESPRNAYINQGMVSIPGDTATAESSYCNPPSDIVVDYKHYFPFVGGTRVSLTSTPFSVDVGFEDLPLDSGMNDYDYNDWILNIDGTATLESSFSDRWTAISFTFIPHGRGATLTHSFHMGIPAGTFPSGGTFELITYGPGGEVLSTQNGVFSSGSDMNFTIFADTSVVFPANFSNTFENAPTVNAQRSAELRLRFTSPITFDFFDYDYTTPHGVGLFFDPYIKVLGSTREIHRGDLRLLNVPEIAGGTTHSPYQLPEEWVRIDKAYPDLTFIPANPPTQPIPDIVFTPNWWLNNNNCVIDDVVCSTPVQPVSPLDFTYFMPDQP
jgi:LruC domain-containing protein